MALHHRHKQRILTTIVMLITLTIAVDAFIILAPYLEVETALLFSFATAIGIITAYQCYNFRHSHEHTTLVNTLTQVFLGVVLFSSAVLILLLHAFFGLDILNSYLALSVAVIILTFLFIKQFDEFLESEIQKKFPMSEAPSPKKTEPRAELKVEPKAAPPARSVAKPLLNAKKHTQR